MEKSQYELCIEVLRRLDKAGILKDIILIGSWCIPFYEEYFSDIKYSLGIQTRDIDFLVASPNKIRSNVNIPELLKDLGFIMGFRGKKGYIKLEHPELVVEFLVPERGKGIDKPVDLPKLGLNATALRFLDFLTDNTIKVRLDDFSITLPHPANFALHKLIIFQRRKKQEKAQKDSGAAIGILKALINKGEARVVGRVFNAIPQKWQSKIIKGLEKIQERDIIKALNS